MKSTSKTAKAVTAMMTDTPEATRAQLYRLAFLRLYRDGQGFGASSASSKPTDADHRAVRRAHPDLVARAGDGLNREGDAS